MSFSWPHLVAVAFCMEHSILRNLSWLLINRVASRPKQSPETAKWDLISLRAPRHQQPCKYDISILILRYSDPAELRCRVSCSNIGCHLSESPDPHCTSSLFITISKFPSILLPHPFDMPYASTTTTRLQRTSGLLDHSEIFSRHHEVMCHLSQFD